MNFIKCSIQEEYYNEPVNLDLVISFEQVLNEGAPCIIFNTNGITVYWFFNDEEGRDKEYDNILGIVNIFEQQKYQ